MTHKYETTWELEIGQGEDIKNKVAEFIQDRGWERACICGAIGSVRDVVLTTPVGMDLPPQVMKTPCDGPGEVLAFTGEVMKADLMDPMLRQVYSFDGPLFIHIHISLACAGAHVYGGGLDKGRAFRGLKIYIAC